MPYFKQPPRMGFNEYQQTQQKAGNLYEDQMWGSVPYFMQKNPATEHMDLEEIMRRARAWHIQLQNRNAQEDRQKGMLELLMKEQEQFAPFPARDMNLMPGWRPFRGRIM